MAKPHGPLVRVSSTLCSAYTPRLSTSSSTRALQGLTSVRPHLEGGFPLRCFQRLSRPNVATRLDAAGATTGTPVVRPSRSSRTKDSSLFKYPPPTTDRDRTVSRRSEPSSRTTLIGEQPNPWNLLQLRDVVSRHRGAEHRRRYGRLGGTSLLSPE